MDEFSFIDMIKQDSYNQSGLIKGIGDDAAVFHEPAEDIVTAVDTFVEEVHFSSTTMDAYHIGYKLLAINVSDLAAMGATPCYYLVSITCPKSYSNTAYERIFQGMRDFASRYKMDIIGGDTVSGMELCISVTVIGTVPKGKARYRSHAKSGDIVFVTGTLGDSQAGLHLLLNQLDAKNKNHFIRKHRQPYPPVEFAKRMRNIRRLSLNDISDGIASEANEIAVASNVMLELISEKLPVSDDYHQFPEKLQREWKLYGGEDFELLGTVCENDWETVKRVAAETNTSLSKIGHVTKREKADSNVLLWENNQVTPLYKKGYTHFQSR